MGKANAARCLQPGFAFLCLPCLQGGKAYAARCLQPGFAFLCLPCLQAGKAYAARCSRTGFAFLCLPSPQVGKAYAARCSKALNKREAVSLQEEGFTRLEAVFAKGAPAMWRGAFDFVLPYAWQVLQAWRQCSPRVRSCCG